MTWTQPPHPPIFGKDFPKKNVFFSGSPIIVQLNLFVFLISVCCQHTNTKDITGQFVILALYIHRPFNQMFDANFFSLLISSLPSRPSIWLELGESDVSNGEPGGSGG